MVALRPLIAIFDMQFGGLYFPHLSSELHCTFVLVQVDMRNSLMVFACDYVERRAYQVLKSANRVVEAFFANTIDWV